MSTWRIVAGAVALAVVLVSGAPARAENASGQALYVEHCAPCHGATGNGDGPDAGIVAEKPRNLRAGFIDAYSTDQLVRRVMDGRALPIELDPAAMRRQASDVEAIASHLERLPAIDWDRVYRGWDLYAERCQECHGPYGAPGATLPSGVRKPRDLSDPAFQRGSTDADLAVAVRHGRSHMPALTPRIGDAEAERIAAYVRILSPGFALYTRYCAHCHGDDGLGAERMPGEIDLPDVRFDRAYLGARDAEELRKNVWHMLGKSKPAMPHYRSQIDESQARAIVDYLRSHR